MSGETSQLLYNSSDVATLLQIKESTLRKYCLFLMEEGYEFLTNEMGYRAYRDMDIVALRKLLELKTEGNMTLKQASKVVVTVHNGKAVATPVITEEQYNSLLEEFQAFRESQEAFGQELLKRLERQQDYLLQQQKYIENRLNERDNNLVQVMKQTLEARREIAATEAQKKWWQFWK